MEQLAKEAEEMSAYKMNSDVVSDTEEWHKRKKLLKNKNQDLSSEYMVDAISCWLIISLEYSFMINLFSITKLSTQIILLQYHIELVTIFMYARKHVIHRLKQ